MNTLYFPLQLDSIKLIEGGIYISPLETGKLQAVKILKLDDFGAHISLYQNQYSEFPSHIDENTLRFGKYGEDDEIFSIEHLPLSYTALASYTLLFVQASTINEHELEGYKIWSEAEGGYF